MGESRRFANAEAHLPCRHMSAATSPGTAPQGNTFRQGMMFVVALAFLTAIGLVLPHGDSGDVTDAPHGFPR